MIGLVAVVLLPPLWPNKNQKNILACEGVQGSNLEFKLIIPKPIAVTYFDTYQGMFSLIGLPMTAI